MPLLRLTTGTLLGDIDLTSIAFVIVVAIAGLGPRCFSQSQAAEMKDGANENRSVLVNAISGEAKRGTVLNYSQHYRSGGKLVAIKGTMYAGITNFTLNKCGLTIGTTIVDRYAGQINKVAIEDTQNIYNFSEEIRLTGEIAEAARVVEARPSQFERGTHPLCLEGRACSIYWLKLGAKERVMKLTSTTNDVAGYEGFIRDFDGMVDEVWIPASSEQAGMELIALIRSYAATCER